MKKQFSVALLRIGTDQLSFNMFLSIQDQSEIEQDGQALVNRQIKKMMKYDRFVMLYMEQGENIPRQDKVYDRNTKKDEKNPRTVDQVERNNQYFFIVDCATQKIYISNFKKKKFFEEWLKVFFKKEVFIKNIIGKDEFLNTLKSVNRIYLSAVPGLFSNQGILNDELTKDYYNYGTGINNISVTISFDDNKFPKKMRNMINKLIFQKDTCAIKELEVSGRYDEKFERVFNAEGIIDKIHINLSQDANGLFDPSEVFEKLIEEIK